MSKLRTLIILLACHAITAHSYELVTHGRITEQAFLRSNLTLDAQLLPSLGLHANSPNPFGTKYYDVSGALALERSSYDFDRDRGRMSNANDAFTIKGWLMRGAIREDDVPHPFGDNPMDDPYDALQFRVFNHFFDPISGSPLTVGITFGKIAPQWAIGSTDIFSALNTPDASRKNHFTVFDAREAMYRALTGMNKQGNPVATTDTQRNKYWATTFRALGDVVHLLQDMAQPQHTRNDPHSGGKYDGSGTLDGIRGHKSVYENYIESRARGDSFTTSGFVDPFSTPSITVQTQPLTYNSYATIPTFNNYLYFYTTQATAILARQGLADYSNRGFFSAGTNLGANIYSYPSNSPNAPNTYTTSLSYQDWNGQPLPLPFALTFVSGNVPDSLNAGATTAAKLTTYSVWDEFLLKKGIQATYTLNRYNYDDMASLLIPRAVAYSAGLINYFFRGKMQISLPDEGLYGIVDHSLGKGFEKIKLKLVNATSNNETMAGGKLVAVARYHINNCYRADLSGEWGSPGISPAACRAADESISTSSAVADAAGSAVNTVTLGANPQAFQFTFRPAIPLGISDLSIQVVYRGPLGNESDAVVAATKNISEPTFFSLFNVTDYVYCVKGSFYRNNADGSISAAAQNAIIALGGTPPAYRPSPYITSRLAFYRSPPFTQPLQLPLAGIDNLQPRQFIRIALLGETGGIPFGLDILNYQFITDTDPSAQDELVTTGNASAYHSLATQSFRGINTHLYAFGYQFWPGGGNCNATDPIVIDNTNPTIPTLVHLNPINSYLP